MSVWKFDVGRVIAAASAVALVTAALTGCSQAAPEIDSDAASRMQASVSAVTQAAAVGDPEGALTALDALEAQLKLDTESGAISAERSAQIQAAIDLVRADLTAALPAPSPTPTSEEKDEKGKGKDDEKGKKDKEDEDD
ncbi:hypothetical protein A20C1_06906 [marine actinobacterium PHSC20C1]|nr:hypothetical protein A20C1_06906 [marine actinobacterium PHSC20C1]